MRFLALLFVLSCAPAIELTEVPTPEAEHDGYVRSMCWAPDNNVAHACCYYEAHDDRVLICTKNGGDTWDILLE